MKAVALPNLSALRGARGVSLREIADSSRIGIGYLQAIERGDLDKLPGGIYTRNYVRQYARAIQFDENDLLRLLGLAS